MLRHIHIQAHAASRKVHLNGQHLFEGPSQEVVNHSPDGFSWGYGGSGPAQLALAIVLQITEGDYRYYQDFKRKYIETLPFEQDVDVKLDISDWVLGHYSPIPWVRLQNGLIVANYSSPHPFTFTDGTVLPACSDDRASEGIIHWTEEYLETSTDMQTGASWDYIRPIPYLTDLGKKDVTKIAELFTWDVVLVPRPVLEALQEFYENRFGELQETLYMSSPFATGRLANRVKKILHTNKFCK